MSHDAASLTWTGFHPNDIGVEYLGNYPYIDSPEVIAFFNRVAELLNPYVHSVNRGEITIRSGSLGAFIGVSGRHGTVQTPVMLVKTWIASGDHTSVISDSVLPIRQGQTTDAWLQEAWEDYSGKLSELGFNVPSWEDFDTGVVPEASSPSGDSTDYEPYEP